MGKRRRRLLLTVVGLFLAAVAAFLNFVGPSPHWGSIFWGKASSLPPEKPINRPTSDPVVKVNQSTNVQITGSSAPKASESSDGNQADSSAQKTINIVVTPPVQSADASEERPRSEPSITDDPPKEIPHESVAPAVTTPHADHFQKTSQITPPAAHPTVPGEPQELGQRTVSLQEGPPEYAAPPQIHTAPAPSAEASVTPPVTIEKTRPAKRIVVHHITIPINTWLLSATLASEISSTKSKQDDPLVLSVTSPSPFKDSRLFGWITQVKQSGRVHDRAVLGLTFDRILLPDGKSLKFMGKISHIKVPKRPKVPFFLNPEGILIADGVIGRDVAVLAAMPAAGAMIGWRSGNSPVGAAAGLASGLVFDLLTKGPEIVLPRDTEIFVDAQEVAPPF